MHAAHLSHYWKYVLRKEVFIYAYMMHGLELVERNGSYRSRYEHHHEILPNWAKAGNLKSFGEAGVFNQRRLNSITEVVNICSLGIAISIRAIQ